MVCGTTQAAIHQHIRHHLLKTRCQVSDGEFSRWRGLGFSLNQPKHRGLQTTEGEVVGVKATPRQGDATFGQRIATVVAALRRGLNGGAARVAQAQKTGNLVERLARSIVVGAAEALHDPVGLHPDQFGVPTTHQQHQIWQCRPLLPQMH